MAPDDTPTQPAIRELPAPVATARVEAEPPMPARPDIPDELEPYIDHDRGDPRYNDYPLSGRQAHVLTFLSRARWGALITTAVLYIITTLGSFALSGQPITGVNALKALLPTRVLEWWNASPWLTAGVGLVVIAIVVVALMIGGRAQRSLDRAERVEKLRVEWRRWKQDVALWGVAHKRWLKESRENQRLRERIEDKLNEALASTKGPEAAQQPQGPPFDTLAAPDDKHFIGRQEDIAWVMERLPAGGIVALIGQPGIGKTALAAVVMRRVRQENRFPDGIAAIACNNIADPIEILRATISRFDPYRRQPQATDLPGMRDAAQPLLRGKHTLVVLDNVEPGLPLADVVEPLRAAGAALLLTARQAVSAAAVPADRSYGVGLLPPDQAEDLFASVYGRGSARDLPADDRAAVKRIALDDLGRHTLAITVAAAYARDAGRDLDELAKELANPARVLSLAGDDEAPEAVRRAFALSLDKLPADAIRIFTALGAFATPEFGRAAALALATGLTPPVADADFDLLVRRSLAQVITDISMPSGTDRERVTLHPLVWALARSELAHQPDEDQRAAQATIAAHYAAYANDTDDTALGPDEANIVGALEWAHAHEAQALVVSFCNGMQYYWRTRGRVPTSLTYLPWGVAAADATQGDRPDDDAGAETLDAWKARANRAFWLRLNLGFAYQIAGRLIEALDEYEQCLALARHAGSRRNEGAAISVIGQIALSRGRLDEAADYFQQSLVIDREVQDRRGEGVDLSNLGQIAQRRGRLDEAADYFQQSLVIRREVQDRQGEGVVLAQLGVIAAALDHDDEADTFYRQGLAALQETEDAINFAAVSAAFGTFLIERRGKRDEGCQMLHEAARLYDEMGVPGGDEARETARSLGCEA